MRVDLSVINRSAREPLHQQLSMLLRQAIRNGVYRPGERLEPERQFMQVGELSYPTVSRALRELADEGLLWRRTGAGTFVADHLPPLNPGLSTIGLFYYDTRTAYFDMLYQAIAAECRLHGIDLVALPAGLADEGQVQIVRELEKRQVDGLIAVPLPSSGLQRELQRLVDAGMPVVSIGVQLPSLACDCITLDNELGANLLAHHLIELGHRRIAYIDLRLPYPHTFNHQVLAGITRALVEKNLPDLQPIELTLPLAFHEHEDDQPRHAILSLFNPDHAPPPTAVICSGDALARYVGNVLGQAGLSVPAQVSLAAFGDMPIAAQLDPPLTTVAWPLARAGRQAVRCLRERSLTPHHQPVHRVLDTHLVVRRSTAEAPRHPARLAATNLALPRKQSR